MHLCVLVVFVTSVGLHAHRAAEQRQCKEGALQTTEAQLTDKIQSFCKEVRRTNETRLSAHCHAKGSFKFKYENTLPMAIMCRPQCDDVAPMCASFNLEQGDTLTQFETSSANNGKLLASPDGKFIAKWIQPNECNNFLDHYWNLRKDTFAGLTMLNIALVILTDSILEGSPCADGAHAIFQRMDAAPLAGTYEGGHFKKSYSRKFDLKGSTFNRLSNEADAEQKDRNFIKQFPTGILIPRADHVILTKQLLNASKWLGKRHFTDYSFMVYLMGNSTFYHPSSTKVPRVIVGRTAGANLQYFLIGGILDNLEKYLDKKYEGKNKIQAVLKLNGIGKSISVAPSYQYACRFFLMLTQVMFLPDGGKVKQKVASIQDVQHTCHSLFTLPHKGGFLGVDQFINFMDML